LKQRTDDIHRMFRDRFGGEPELTVQAPGRVNLIGEHTDYNDGFVFPMAIERSVMICGRRRDDRLLLMHQPAMGGSAEASLDQIEKDTAHPWADYILGVARELLQLGCSIRGAEITVAGNVPIGSGLSSSAAMEVATATFFETLCGLEIEPRDVALLCQRAENTFVGVNCGIMDQFVSKLGRAGHALMLDCRSLEYRQAPFDDPAVHVIVADTGLKRGLVDSEYNTRRAECEAGARRLGELLGKPVKALRDVSAGEFRSVQAELPEPVLRRCRHVVSENERVLECVAALEAGDLKRFGKLLNESHVSLRDDYEVSCDALNLMADLLRAQDGMLGARMTGGGFGGCAIGVLREENDDRVNDVCDRVAARYRERTGLEPNVFTTRAAAGAGAVPA
jgi:galactokinase